MPSTLPDTLTLIRQLIAEPSVSSCNPAHDLSNLAVIHLLAEWAETLGFAVEIRPISPTKANLIATLGNSENPGGLVLSGHTDTVPCNPERWHSDPFKATIRDERLYGLGSADMKSFFALALAAATRFEARQLQQPLVILATADEESTMQGARTLLAENACLGRYAVIGEPTGLKPVRMHKGIAMNAVTVRGKAGHSSDPAQGANAIEGMRVILGELLAFAETLKQRHRHPAFKVDHPTLNLGAIHGGDNPNRICDRCEVHFDMRLLPGMSLTALHQELEEWMHQGLLTTPGLSLEISQLFAGIPAFETAADEVDP